MTTTYTNDPANNPVDAVRFWIADTTAPFQVSDEEIRYVLTLYPNAIAAAAAIANELAMKWALSVDKAVGDLKISYSQRAKFYAEMADRLKNQADQNGAQIFAGGTNLSEMAANAGNGNRNPQPFDMYQFDIPGACGPALPACGEALGGGGGGCSGEGE